MSAPPVDIVRAVRDELAVPGRYHLTNSATGHRSLVEQFFAWLWDRWNDLFHAFSAHIKIGARGTALIGDVIVVACVIGIAAIAAHLLTQMQYERSRRERAVALTSERSAHAFASAAAAAAANGDYARAIRLTFIAAVTMLDLRGVLRDDRAATINELRRALRSRNEALDGPFAEIARLYTSAAYAQSPAGSDAWQRARSAYDRLAGGAGA